MRVFSLRSQRLFYIVKLFVYTMKIVGLAPFGVRIESSAQISSLNPRVEAFHYSKIGLAYNILLSIMTVVFVVIVNLRPPFDEPAVDLVSNIVHDSVDRADVILMNFTICIIFIAWGTRQERAASVMNKLLEIDLGLTSFEKPPFNKRTLICAIIHLLLITLSWGWGLYWIWKISNHDGHSFVLKMIPYVCQRCIIFWFITEYNMVVGLVADDIEVVNKYLLNLKETGTYLFPQSFRHGLLQATECSSSSQDLAHRKLIYYHTIRTRIYKLCGEIGDFFSLPILFGIASSSASLCQTLFRLIRNFQTDIILQRSVASLFSWLAMSILSSVYPIISLALNVTRIRKEAQLTKQIVDTLSEVAIRKEIIAELELFSRQLLHENISFTAYGFFSLDSGLLLSILGGVTTYFIALGQLPDKGCS